MAFYSPHLRRLVYRGRVFRLGCIDSCLQLSLFATCKWSRSTQTDVEDSGSASLSCCGQSKITVIAWICLLGLGSAQSSYSSSACWAQDFWANCVWSWLYLHPYWFHQYWFSSCRSLWNIAVDFYEEGKGQCFSHHLCRTNQLISPAFWSSLVPCVKMSTASWLHSLQSFRILLGSFSSIPI